MANTLGGQAGQRSIPCKIQWPGPHCMPKRTATAGMMDEKGDKQ